MKNEYIPPNPYPVKPPPNMPAPRKESLEAENARLKSEVERLNSNLLGRDATIMGLDSTIKCQKAEVERLTKAGDELHAFLINCIVESRISSAYLNKLDDGWLAAKEGKPRA